MVFYCAYQTKILLEWNIIAKKKNLNLYEPVGTYHLKDFDLNSS